MRPRTGIGVLLVTASAALGQTPPSGIKPASAEKTAPDFTRMIKPPSVQEQTEASARRGAEWLFRMNQIDGRFVPGWLPALSQPMDADHFLRQAGAAFALARAARYFKDDRYAARARQAVLSLMAETRVDDPAKPRLRYTMLPSLAVNRLAAAGLLLGAIHELPSPADDLVQQGEELAAFVYTCQRPDGSLRYTDGATDAQTADDWNGIAQYPGPAMYGVMLSQRAKPAKWKTDLVRKAVAYYRPIWKEHPSLAFASWQGLACAEAYARTKEPAFAEFAFEMAEWLCGCQFGADDPRRLAWRGGFLVVVAGQPQPPTVESAGGVEALAAACAIAKVADPGRVERYKGHLTRGCQFLAALQYTEANTYHFAPAYRPVVLGGFHAAPQNADLRIDYNQHAVSALILALACP